MPIKYKVTYITAALQGFQKLIYVGVINVFDIYHEDRPHALMIQMIGTNSLNCKTSILKCHRFNVNYIIIKDAKYTQFIPTNLHILSYLMKKLIVQIKLMTKNIQYCILIILMFILLVKLHKT